MLVGETPPFRVEDENSPCSSDSHAEQAEHLGAPEQEDSDKV